MTQSSKSFSACWLKLFVLQSEFVSNNLLRQSLSCIVSRHRCRTSQPPLAIFEFQLVNSLCSSSVFRCSFLPHFHPLAPWNWFPPACLLPLWATLKLGRGKKQRHGRPYFSFKEGFTLLPRKTLFLLTLSIFLDKNRENMWAQMHQVQSGGVRWRMLRRWAAFNPLNQFGSIKLLHCTKW